MRQDSTTQPIAAYSAYGTAPAPIRATPPGRPELHLGARSPAFRTALHRLERLARFEDATVLLEGESGTGKTALAQYLHQCSPRSNQRFHRVALSGLADSLAASELFGHIKGAFTDASSTRAGHFATAHGGTLFLDEIGKASEIVQHKLLDCIERKEIAPLGADRSVRIDVRIVAATNVPLPQLAREGRFLPDLLARLESFTVRIPALRERRDDIPALVEHLVAVRGPRFGYPRRPPDVDAELLEALAAADWPNNVRQLDGAVCALMIEADGAPRLTIRHCRHDLSRLRARRTRAPADVEAVQSVLREKKTKQATAEALGVSRSTVHRRLREIARQAGVSDASLTQEPVCHDTHVASPDVFGPTA